jgi:hypothetical protein
LKRKCDALELTARWAVAIYDDTDTNDDVIVVEAVVASFTPVRDGLQCPCGALVRAFALRATADGAELHCHRCHRVHGHIDLGVKVHRS